MRSTSELEGEATPNEHYIGSRLAYRDGEAEALDPISPRYWRALRVHWGISFTIFIIGAALIALIGAVLGSPKLAVLLLTVWVIAIGVIALFFPVSVSLSEWKFMIDGKASASGNAFEHIAFVFRERNTPVEKMKVHRLSLGGSASRDYLYVQDGVFRAYVTCFPYGNDLFVGWTFWWHLSAARWWWTTMVRRFQTLTLRNSEVYSVLRYDSAKALREAVHSAARQGLDAAAGLVAFRGTGTVGKEIAVEDIAVPQSNGTGASPQAPRWSATP